MPDYSKMSDNELYQLAGMPVPFDYSSMSDEKLFRLAGIDKPAEPLTTEETAKGLTANVLQGLTGGAGALISGAGNVMANPVYRFTRGMEGLETPKTTIAEQFKAGKEAFQEPERKFAAAHPVISTIAQIAGSIPTAGVGGAGAMAGKVPVLTKMGRGALTGAGLGAAYGAGSNIADVTQSALESGIPKLEDIINLGKGAAKGAGYGAAIGGLLPLAGSGLLAGARGVKALINPRKAGVTQLMQAVSEEPKITQFPAPQINEVKPIGFTGARMSKETGGGVPLGTPKGIQQIAGEFSKEPIDVIRNEVGNLADKSVSSNTPLIAMSEPEGSIHNLAMGIKLNSKEGAKILRAYARPEMEKMPVELNQAVDSVLGTKNHFQNLDEIEAAYKAKAAPAYEAARAYGDLAPRDPSIVELSQDPFMQKYIQAARKSPIGRELKTLPDTDISVLDAAKQKLDDAIGVAVRTGEKNEARALQGLKSELVGKIDKIAPEYGQARQIASEKFKLEEAQEDGAKLIRSETPESIERLMAGKSAAEIDSMKIGIRDELKRQIAKGASSSRSNVALKVFSETENSLVRQNMKALLGNDYTALMAKVDPIVKKGRNLTDLMEGSQTAEKLSSALHVPRGKFKALVRLAKYLTSEQMDLKSQEIARMLVDPNYLANRIKGGATGGAGVRGIGFIASQGKTKEANPSWKAVKIENKQEPLPIKEKEIDVSSSEGLKAKNLKQIEVIKESGIPKEERVNYINDSIADGAKLEKVTKDVLSNKKDVEKAAREIGTNYDKMLQAKEPIRPKIGDIAREIQKNKNLTKAQQQIQIVHESNKAIKKYFDNYTEWKKKGRKWD